MRLSANAPICRCNRSQAQFPPHFQTRSESRRSGSQFLFYSLGLACCGKYLLHMRAPNLAVLPLPLPSSPTCFIQANHKGAFSTNRENITHLTRGKKEPEGQEPISATKALVRVTPIPHVTPTTPICIVHPDSSSHIYEVFGCLPFPPGKFLTNGRTNRWTDNI